MERLEELAAQPATSPWSVEVAGQIEKLAAADVQTTDDLLKMCCDPKGRKAMAEKTEAIMDVNQGTVEEYLRRFHARRLIHGHTHRPARHETDTGLRWVLGAWEERGWFLEADAGGIALSNFYIYQ